MVPPPPAARSATLSETLLSFLFFPFFSLTYQFLGRKGLPYEIPAHILDSGSTFGKHFWAVTTWSAGEHPAFLLIALLKPVLC